MTTDGPGELQAPRGGPDRVRSSPVSSSPVSSSPVSTCRSAGDRADDLRAEQRIIFAQTSRRIVESRRLLDRSTPRTVQPWAPALP